MLVLLVDEIDFRHYRLRAYASKQLHYGRSFRRTRQPKRRRTLKGDLSDYVNASHSRPICTVRPSHSANAVPCTQARIV